MSQPRGRLFDAICIAREIQKTSPEIFQALPVEVSPALVSFAENRAKLKVEIGLIPVEHTKARGYLLRYNKRAEIMISDSQSFCWRRYVITKELSHLIADTEDQYLTGDLIDYQADMALKMRTGRYYSHRTTSSGATIPDRQGELLDSESFSWHLAFHLLVPWKRWPEFLSLLDSGNTFQAAEQFKIPRTVVEDMRDTSYRELCIEAHETYSGQYEQI